MPIDDDVSNMTPPRRGELHEIARLTAKATVQETFIALGVDVVSPAGMIETQQDFAWTRSARLTVKKVKLHAITVLIGLMTSGVVWAVWEAVRSARAGR